MLEKKKRSVLKEVNKIHQDSLNINEICNEPENKYDTNEEGDYNDSNDSGTELNVLLASMKEENTKLEAEICI